ncbi:UDP-N-acetylmuramoyl-tripeptide--D-alanyl-D-alanine ligase [Clostridia bacterium]|nr:UDP-N-acetylmuramoyl-tripeptide--D-alanyl-D-alanine ligase [Clostridia bacterium]
MEPFSVSKIKEAVNGSTRLKKYDRVTIDGVSIDSREEQEGKLFVAIAGEQTDGHEYIGAAIEKGASAVLSEKTEEELGLNTGKPFIVVESARTALKELAKAYIKTFDIPIVAVTGSVGKTTTKDIIASVMSTEYKTLKTEGNYNNEIGLPLTVFRLDKSYKAAVFEMGMRHSGEIHALADIVRPNICVITNIGYSHVENLVSRQGIFLAKSEILDFRDKDTKVIVNGDDDLLCTLPKKFPNVPISFFGVNNKKNRFYAEDIKEKGLYGVSCAVCYDGERFQAQISHPGRHMVRNALAAAAVGVTLGIDPRSIKNGIENFRASKMRMDIINTQNGITVIDDTYNASPDSVAAAISVLSVVKTRKICILGDMLELGEDSPIHHYTTGKDAALAGIDTVLCVGSLSENTYKGVSAYIKGNQRAFYFETRDDLENSIFNYVTEGDTVLIKASRAMELEKITEILQKGKGEV